MDVHGRLQGRPRPADLWNCTGTEAEAGTGRATKTRGSRATHTRRTRNAQCFNTADARHCDVFATVGQRRATIYRRRPVNGEASADDATQGSVEVLQSYVDDDPNETLFCCVFTRDVHDGDKPLLCVAGDMGVIRVLDCHKCGLRCSLPGHGNAVNELKVHPARSALLLSASKDESVRLWNIRTRTLVLICAGDGGHRSEVLSIDWHLDAESNGKFASCGMDNAIKIWSLEKYSALMDESETYGLEREVVVIDSDSDSDSGEQAGHPRAPKRPKHNTLFPTRFVNRPIFSTTKVHQNYVDCVRWFGNLLLTKSVHSKIVLWRPDESGPTKRAGDVCILQEYCFEQCNLWFIRFSLDPGLTRLCVGNRMGTLYLWSVPGVRAESSADDSSDDPDVVPLRFLPSYTKLKAAQNKFPIRQTALSTDGRTVLGCSEDGTIWRFDDVAGSDGGGGGKKWT